MDTLIPKSQMTEEDIKLNFITPALVNRGWNNKITMETMVKFTDGKINLGAISLRAATLRRPIISFISALIIRLLL